MSEPNYAEAIAQVRGHGLRLTDDQKLCLYVLACFAGGEHHVHGLDRAESNGMSMAWVGEVASFDAGDLTKLVLLAHAWGVRVTISPGGGDRLEITAHRRALSDDLEDMVWTRHPTLAGLIERATKLLPKDAQPHSESGVGSVSNLVADCENRAASLMREAVSLGCDTPTEAMISAAIYDAVCDHEQRLESSLEQGGHPGAARYLARCRELRHLESGVEP